MFQSLRNNSQLFILYKGDPKIEIGMIKDISKTPPPTFQQPIYAQYMAKPEETLTITVNVAGQELVFPGVPYMADSMDYPSKDMFIADNNGAINIELNRLKNLSIDAINSVPVHEKKIAAYDKILKEINPDYAERLQQKEEINSLKEQMATLLEMNKNLMAKLNSGTVTT